jgi:cytokinin dehydrogenase
MRDEGVEPSAQILLTGAAGKSRLQLLPLAERLRVDEAALLAAGADFGNIIHRRPLAVVEPASREDIVTVLEFAREHGLAVAARGEGHSTFGQSQTEAGIVVRIRTLVEPPVFGDDWVEVSAGMTWREVLRATLTHGLCPPLLTDNAGLSVGGTLSVGGINGRTFRQGAQVDNVLALEVLTGKGRIERCSEAEQPDLFHAVLAGLGQCAIILRATLRLIPAPTHAHLIRLFYPDLRSLLRDERKVIAEGRADRMVGNIWPSPIGGWIYWLELGWDQPASSLPADSALLAGLGGIPGSERVFDLSFFDSVALTPALDALYANGRARLPHPWFDVFIPGSSIAEFAGEFFSDLKGSETAADFPTGFYPLRPPLSRTPLLRLPQEPDAFLFDFLCTVSDEIQAARMVERNERFYGRVRAMGGSLYPIGSTPLSPEAWQAHFGPHWEGFAAAKHRYDPDNVLAPGQGIFPTGDRSMRGIYDDR